MTRFQPGQSGNPAGRPPKVKNEPYLIALKDCLSIPDWEAIVQRAITDAKKGDRHARKWLSDYLLGPPTQSFNVSGNLLDGIEDLIRDKSEEELKKFVDGDDDN